MENTSRETWMDKFRLWFHRAPVGHREAFDLASLNPWRRAQAEMLLSLTRVIDESRGAVNCRTDDLLSIPCGADEPSLVLLRSLERWLRSQPLALAGRPRVCLPPESEKPEPKPLAVPVLLFNGASKEGEPGVPARLLVELFPRTAERGVLYPHREMLFTDRSDKDWSTATIRAAASFDDPWQQWDVRWRLVLQETGRPPSSLKGPSAGGAFQYALHCLFTNTAPQQGIGISAAIKPDGKWTDVGALPDKLLAATRRSYPPLHTVVVAKDQNLKGIEAGFNHVNHSATGTDYLFKAEGTFGRLAIVQAVDFADGLRRGVAPAQNRWKLFDDRGVMEPPAPKLAIHRIRFIETITRRVDTMESGFLLIQGEMGAGKTVAMGQLVTTWREAGRYPVCYFLPKEHSNAQRPGEIARHLLLQLCLKHNFHEPDDWRERFGDRYDNRLEAFLSQLSQHLLPSGTREVIVVEAADQAVLEDAQNLIPSVLRSPPPGIIWLISSRPRKSPVIDKNLRLETLEFSTLVDDRVDSRQLIERRAAALTPPGLDPALVNAICDSETPPVMFTLDWALNQIESPESSPVPKTIRDSLRRDATYWLREPRRLVYEELGWVLEAAGRLGLPPDETRRWLLLTTFTSDLTKDLLEGLGFPTEKAMTVFRLAANFFSKPGVFALRHPGYARAIRGEEIPVGEISDDLAEDLRLPRGSIAAAHQLIGERCLVKWADPSPDNAIAACYALHSVCEHLRGAGMGVAWHCLLMETPEFLFRRGETAGTKTLVKDFPIYGDLKSVGLTKEQAQAMVAVRDVIRSRGHIIEGALSPMTYLGALVQELRSGLLIRIETKQAGLPEFMERMEGALPKSTSWLRLETAPKWVSSEEVLVEAGEHVTSIVCMPASAPNDKHKWVAVGSYGSISIWDWVEVRAVLELTLPTKGSVTALCFSPDGERVAAANISRRELGPTRRDEWATQISYWDLSTKIRHSIHLDEFSPRYNTLDSLEFSPLANLLAAKNHDGGFRIWNIALDPPVLIDARTDVTSFCFAPDGRRLAIASKDGEVQIWTLTDEGATNPKSVDISAPHLWQPHTRRPALAMKFFSSGELLACGGNHFIRILNLEKNIITYKDEDLDRALPDVTRLEISDDGQFMVVDSSGDVVSIDVSPSEHSMRTIHDKAISEDVEGIGIVASGQHVVIASTRGAIIHQLRFQHSGDLNETDEIEGSTHDYNQPAYCACVSQSGNCFAVRSKSGVDIWRVDKSGLSYQGSSRDFLWEHHMHSEINQSICFSKRGESLLKIDESSTLIYFTPELLEQENEAFESLDEIRGGDILFASVQLSTDDRHIALVGTSVGESELWSYKTNYKTLCVLSSDPASQKYQVSGIHHLPDSIVGMAFSADGSMLAVGTYYEVWLWDITDGFKPESGVMLEKDDDFFGIVTVEFSPNDLRLFVGTGSDGVWSMDLAPSNLAHKFDEVLYSDNRVFGMSFSSDGELLSTVSKENSVWVGNPRTNEYLAQCELPGRVLLAWWDVSRPRCLVVVVETTSHEWFQDLGELSEWGGGDLDYHRPYFPVLYRFTLEGLEV